MKVILKKFIKNFSYCPALEHFDKVVLMRDHNISLNGELEKIVPVLIL